MYLKTALALAVGLCLGGCVTQSNQAAKVDAAYVNRINARLADYNRQSAQFDEAIKLDAQQVPTDAAKIKALTDIMGDAQAHARAAILTRFVHEAAASGQFGLMTSWLQSQVADLQRSSQETDAKASKLKVALSQAQPPLGLASQVLDFVGHSGWDKGTAEELVAIANDVAGYEKDYSGAAQIDEQRRREAAQALAAYLSAPRVTVQAPLFLPGLPMPSFTNCMATLTGMNCITQ